MSAPKPAEPSMEDILASIRRIIADEGSGSEAPKPFDDEPSGFDESTTFSEETAEAEPEDKADIEAEADAGVEMEAESVNVDEIDFDSISIDPEPDDMPADDDGLLELTDDMIADDGPPAPVEPMTDDVAFDDGQPELVETVLEPEQDWAAPQADDEPATASSGDIDTERLMSPATDAIVGSAFGRLANAILSNEARTVEDLIKEMLRPMLREWIDDNLPQVVERLVREEIERAARGR